MASMTTPGTHVQGAGRHDGADRPEATNQAFARHTPWPRPSATKADDTPLTLSSPRPSLGETDLSVDGESVKSSRAFFSLLLTLFMLAFRYTATPYLKLLA